jgi:hypothetical protein
MESGISHHTRRLINAKTLKENLQVLYDEFSATIGHACYRELVRSQLPTRILRARRRLDELAEDEHTLRSLQREYLHRSPVVEPALAAVHVRNKLDDLARMLDSVIPQADAIDKRAAEFARRAFARVRYLQEISTGRRESVQALFETIDANLAGVRLNEIPDTIWLPALRIGEVGILSGDALRNPPLRRQAGEIEPIGDELSDSDREEAWRKVQDNVRDNLNVLRANRFVLNLPGESGAEFPIEGLGLRNDDDIADLVACLLQASARDASFGVHTQRAVDDVAEPQLHRAAGYMIEDLRIIKK